MKLWKKTPTPQPIKEPRRVIVSDIVEYHRDKDGCHMCIEQEWACPQHFNINDEPHYKTAVDDGFQPAVPWKPRG